MAALKAPLKYGSVTIAAWLLLWLRLVPIPEFVLSRQASSEILNYFPWWALISLGAYCLGTLGYGVLTFGDCEPAYQELEIGQAKEELRTKGVRVD